MPVEIVWRRHANEDFGQDTACNIPERSSPSGKLILDIVRAAAAGGGVPMPPFAVGGTSWRSPAVARACLGLWADPTGSEEEGARANRDLPRSYEHSSSDATGRRAVATANVPWTRVRRVEQFCAHSRNDTLAVLKGQSHSRTGGRRRDGRWRVGRSIIG